jgi:hypothetical protein
MNSVNFVKGQGGLGRVLPGEDHFSGLLMYVPTANYSKRLKRYNSLNEAIADGITNADGTETKASNGNLTFTAVGGLGKVWTVKVDDVLLCIYTEVTGLTTTTLATAIYNAINAGTATHGYTATNGTTSQVALVAPVGLGSSINTGSHLTAVCTATGTVTITQFGATTAGVYAIYKPLYYHIAEFFRLNPNGALFVHTVSSSAEETTFAQIVTLQTFAEGKIRQLGIYQPYYFSGSHVTNIQTKVTILESDNKPLSVLYACDMTSVAAYGSLADLRALSAKNVSVVIGEDGASTGATLANEKRYSISCLGAALGTVSLAAVNENIGWVGKFNIAAVELDTPAMSFNDSTYGRLIKNYTTAALDAINAKGYVFLVKHLGVSGSYFNDSHTAIPATSDYAYIENNRTIDKAIRGIRTYLVPEINSPVKVDAVSGKLDMNRVKYLEAQASIALDQMMRNSELSGYQVTIDPDQNVLGTSTINVTVQLVPVGVARTITVTVGFVTKLT